MKKNQKGFAALEGILILIIVALIGFVGWYVYHTKNNTDKTLNTAASTKVATQKTSTKTTTTTKTADTYAGWKTATLQYEKITFQYPADWSLNNTSKASDCVTPGTDSATITAPNSGAVFLSTGVGCHSGGGGTAVSSIPISGVLGQNYYLSFIYGNTESPGDSPYTSATLACIRDSSPQNNTSAYSGSIPSKNITSSNPNFSIRNDFCYETPPNGQTKNGAAQNKEQSPSDMQADPDLINAKLIFQSMKY